MCMDALIYVYYWVNVQLERFFFGYDTVPGRQIMFVQLIYTL